MGIISLAPAGPLDEFIEVTRSFSFKQQLGHFQSADHFCSAKVQTPRSRAEEMSELVYEFAKGQVLKSVRAFHEEFTESREYGQLPERGDTSNGAFAERARELNASGENPFKVRAKEQVSQSGADSSGAADDTPPPEGGDNPAQASHGEPTLPSNAAPGEQGRDSDPSPDQKKLRGRAKVRGIDGTKAGSSRASAGTSGVEVGQTPTSGSVTPDVKSPLQNDPEEVPPPPPPTQLERIFLAVDLVSGKADRTTDKWKASKVAVQDFMRAFSNLPKLPKPQGADGVPDPVKEYEQVLPLLKAISEKFPGNVAVDPVETGKTARKGYEDLYEWIFGNSKYDDALAELALEAGVEAYPDCPSELVEFIELVPLDSDNVAVFLRLVKRSKELAGRVRQHAKDTTQDMIDLMVGLDLETCPLVDITNRLQ